MSRVVLGAVGALLLAGVGLFWWQGRAVVEAGAPPPIPESATPAADSELPTAEATDMIGPAPPEATELTREQRRFFLYDRNRDLKITRREMLSSRTNGFRKLDVDGNNLLTFEEWAVATVQRFEMADADGNQELTAEEFATTAPKRKTTKRCNC